MTIWTPWILASLLTAALAAVLPWLLRVARKPVAFFGLLAALLTFTMYEVVLYRSVPSDTVVLQTGLVVLLPLLLVAVLSCGIVICSGGGRNGA